MAQHYDGDDTKLKGGTDETPIGNVGDRLKVDSTTSNVGLDNSKIFSSTVLVNASSSSLNNPLLYLRNPAGSGKKLYILRASGNTTISNERTLFGVHLNPTVVVNGVATPVVSRDLGGVAVSVVQAFTLPTITALGATISWTPTGDNTSEQEFVGFELALLKPGNNILVSGQPKSNNRVQAITLIWFEETL